MPLLDRRKKLRERSKYYLSTTSGSGSSGGAFLDGASYSGLLGRAGRRSAGLLGRRSTVYEIEEGAMQLL